MYWEALVLPTLKYFSDIGEKFEKLGVFTTKKTSRMFLVTLLQSLYIPAIFPFLLNHTKFVDSYTRSKCDVSLSNPSDRWFFSFSFQRFI